MKRLRRTLSVVLSAVLVLQMGFTPAMAQVPSQTTIIGGSLCEHHQHTADCGYATGTPCTFTKEQCKICTPKDSGGMPALGVSSITVTKFDPLPTEVTQRVVSVGTTLDELNLPAALGAMGYTSTADTKVADSGIVDSGTPSDATTPAALRIEGVTWALDPTKNVNANKEYNPLLGTYCFTPVLPEGYTLAEGVALPELWVRVGDKARAETVGGFTVTDGTEGKDYSYDKVSGVLTILTDTALIISNVSADATADRIVVDSGVTANLTLNDVNIKTNGEYFHPLDIAGAAANITLTGTNTLVGTSEHNDRGKYFAGIHVPKGAALTIKGTGTLTANGGGAGIGGGGAGIGGGGSESGGTITINGGTVNANGGIQAAGIGGGGDSINTGIVAGAGGTITITGGTVNATGFSAPGIGGGNAGAGGEVAISGDAKVTAIGGGGNAGISNGGISGAGGTIAIFGTADVTATGGNSGAGIGGSYGASGGEITISGDAKVDATGGYSGAGIGGGYGASGGKITISGGTVAAIGKESDSAGTSGAAGIGGGDGAISVGGVGGAGGDVAISGGTVIATGGTGSPAIGAVDGGADGTLTITGGSVQLVQDSSITSTPATNAAGTPLKLVTLTMSDSDSAKNKLLTWLKFPGCDYGAADIHTDAERKVYVWLPATATPATVYATVGSSIYGNIAPTATKVTLSAFDATVTSESDLTTALTNSKAQILVSESFTIAASTTITISTGITLTIKPDVTITNNGIIALTGGKVNHGEPDYGIIAIPSTATLTVLNNVGATITTAVYGDTVTLKVTAAKKVAPPKNRSALWDKAIFYLGTNDKGTKLGEGNVTFADGKATATVNIRLEDNAVKGIDWAIAANSLFVDFGGSGGGLLGSTAGASLTVTIDVSAIDTAIVAANIEKGKVTISDWPASSVANGTKFVTTAEMKALTDAINTATAAKSTVNTLAKAATAASALGGAVSTFKAVIKTGTHTSGGGGGGGGGTSGGGNSTPETNPADKITNVSNSYTKYYGDKAFTLKAKGNGKISYSSNNKTMSFS